MFKAIIPPLCLLIALALAITGTAMIAFGGPEESISLHEARVSGDDLTKDTLEQDLEQKQFSRVVFITTLFATSGIMIFVGFATMTGPTKN